MLTVLKAKAGHGTMVAVLLVSAAACPTLGAAAALVASGPLPTGCKTTIQLHRPVGHAIRFDGGMTCDHLQPFRRVAIRLRESIRGRWHVVYALSRDFGTVSPAEPVVLSKTVRACAGVKVPYEAQVAALFDGMPQNVKTTQVQTFRCR